MRLTKIKLANIKMKLTNMKIFRRLINRVNANTSKLKLNASKKMNQIKRKLKNKVKNFREEGSSGKSDPKSKEEAFFLGLSLGLGTLGLVFLAKRLPAFAKEIENNKSKPVGPTQTPAQAIPLYEKILTLCAATSLAATGFIVGICIAALIYGIDELMKEVD